MALYLPSIDLLTPPSLRNKNGCVLYLLLLSSQRLTCLLYFFYYAIYRMRMGMAIVPVGVACLVGPPICGAILGVDYVWWRGILFASVSGSSFNSWDSR